MKSVRLQGLYDEHRAEELQNALLPIIRGECEAIDMTDVDEIERVALTGFLPMLVQLRPGDLSPKIPVIGMNDTIARTMEVTGLAKFFILESR